MTIYFWWSVGFIYAGLGIILLDVQFERFPGYAWLRWAISGCVGCIFVAFSVGVVFTSAPLTAEIYTIKESHAPGSVYGGIRWDEKMTDLRAWITNGTAENYEDLDLMVGVSDYIIGVGQLQSLPECHVSPAVDVEMHATATDVSGSHLIVPPMGRTLGMEYRVICKSFPSRTAIQLIMATEGDSATVVSKKVTFRGTYKAGLRIRNIDGNLTRIDGAPER